MLHDFAERRRFASAAAAALWTLLGFNGNATAAPAGSPVPAGSWIWDDGRAGVEFHPCGETLCGRIVWLKQEATQGSPPLLDVKNPDPALRSRRVCGLDYITAVKRTADGHWKNGRVYDFNGGASYDLDIDAVEAGKVRMRGYKGIRMLGATLVLVRPKSELQPCMTSH